MMEKNILISYKVYTGLEQLMPQDRELLEKAIANIPNAYAPYSNFQVGAAILLANGKIIGGSNQENAVYPLGLCAERVAAFSASSQYPNIPILSIALSGSQKDKQNTHPISPCGSCRQVLLEYELFYKQKIRIIMGGTNGEIHIFESAQDLLPLQFDAGELKKS